MAGVAAFQATSLAALAQSYPAKPVRVIVPFAPAGPADVLARLMMSKLSQSLGQQFYIENQAGAGGNLGMAAAARAAPDGYTIAVVSTSFVVNPSLYPKIPYDPYKDFAPVTLAAVSPNVLVVHPSIPASNVKELIAFLKANPGKYSFAHSGVGTTPHLSGEMFKRSQELDIVSGAVQRLGSGNSVGARRPYAGRLHGDDAGCAAGQGWQAPLPGGHDAEAFVGAARCADPGRGRAVGSGGGYDARRRGARPYA